MMFYLLSPLLKELFDTANLKQPSELVAITLDSFNPCIVETLIEYIYEGEVKVNCLQMANLQSLCQVLKLKLPINCKYRDIDYYSRISEMIDKDISQSEEIASFADLSVEPYGEPMECQNEIEISLTKLETSYLESEEPQCISSCSENESNYLELIDHSKPINNDTSMEESLKDWEQYCVYVSEQCGQKSASINLVCSQCGLVIGSKHLLTKHMKIVHSMIRKFECTYCGYITEALHHFKRHVDSQHYNVKFPCDRCDSSFASRDHLNRHIKIVHDKIRAYQCDDCPFAAKRNGQLKKHKEMHHTIASTVNVDNM